jgi:hypothetical protein
MPKKSNQKVERSYFEMFHKDYPLPMGSIIYGDKPDVILEGERKIGIEITNFFLEEGNLPESEQVQRKAREKVISDAQRMYQASNRKKVEFTLGFDKTNPIRDQKSLVKKIVELAKYVEGWKTGGIRKDIFQEIPELSSVYLNAEEYTDARWKIVQGYRTPIMSTEKLRNIVKEKEDKSKEYKRCDTYWLLVVVDFVDRAQDQEIQIDEFEKIDSDVFEKIVVYKTLFGHVLETK